MSAPEHRTLGEAAAEWGEAVPCAGNLPVDPSDSEFVWFIEAGAIDLFLVKRRNGVAQSAPRHMLRAGTGRLLFGIAPQVERTSLELVAKGLPDTMLRRLPVARLDAIRTSELAEQIDAWIRDLSEMLARDVMPRPRVDSFLEPGDAPTTASGILAARRGVVWVTGLPPGTGLFMSLIDAGDGEPDAPGDGSALPLTPTTWLATLREAQFSTASTAELAERNQLMPALNRFNHTAVALERLHRRLAVVDQANLERVRVINRRGDEEGARRRLFNVYGLLDAGREDVDEPTLHDALRAIGRHEGITFRGAAATERSTTEAALAKVLSASGVRGRRVRLSASDRWWVGDSGAMLAFRTEDGRPVALLPGMLGHYREFDPVSQRTRRVTAARAALLSPDAWFFYPPLKSAVASPRDLMKIARTRMGPDLARFVATGLPGALVMLLPALMIGFVADEVIPAGDVGMLYGITVALVAVGVVRALLLVLRGMALMRLEGRVASRMEAAFWDRLLRLPAGVLKRYPASDLAARGRAFQTLRDAVQGVAGNGALSIIFLTPAFLIIGFRDPALGGLTAAFGLLSLLVTVALGLRQIAPHRRRLRAIRGLSSRLFQLIDGMSKLRIDRAEGSGFAVWARDYREQKRAELELGAAETHLQAFGTALPLLAGALLILAVSSSGQGSFSVGDFIVVYVLFLLYQTAVIRLGESFGVLAAVVPALNQIGPLLAETPETSVERESVDMLGGDIAFDRVSFRYDADGPLILDDVSIQARAGEFVAIAGESGAGKSTILRLALGMERPSSGSVYFDGRDLRQLDVNQVRRHIGVVPQQVRLHPQDLWDNIVGDRDATSEEAWSAARDAAVDREIAAMPMGMLTPVGAGAEVTSGGESQRIQIARALIRQPRILLLDEATNWLDNKTQSEVMANLARLTSTRIVIAHRLSTLRQADRIYVMRRGRIVQEGPYAELVETAGAFQDLVRRQMV